MNDKKPLAIIPFGTANIFALEAGIHGSADEIAKIILSNKIKKVYVPAVNNKNFIIMIFFPSINTYKMNVKKIDMIQ